MVSAVHCDDPVVIFDNRTLYFGEKQEIATGRPPAPVGGSHTRRTGPAATVVTWGAVTQRVLEAADRLADSAVSVTVIETPWLNPFDTDTVIESVARTGGRLAVVHEANTTAGFGAEVSPGCRGGRPPRPSGPHRCPRFPHSRGSGTGRVAHPRRRPHHAGTSPADERRIVVNARRLRGGS
jgi:pyruvate dehydrogenase E1 component beta subunit/2-oxoisovalerate dehydrogenase E1 component